jgi:hypothetical protein
MLAYHHSFWCAGVVYLVTGVHEFLHFLRSNKPAHANKGRGFISLVITGALTLITVALFVAGEGT